MATASKTTGETTNKPARTRKAKPRKPDVCRLTVTIRGESYSARPIHSVLPEVIRAWRLRKADGTTYDVADTIDGATCDCADQVFRHEGNDATGCKHIRALRALGLIDPDGEAPGSPPGPSRLGVTPRPPSAHPPRPPGPRRVGLTPLLCPGHSPGMPRTDRGRRWRDSPGMADSVEGDIPRE